MTVLFFPYIYTDLPNIPLTNANVFDMVLPGQISCRVIYSPRNFSERSPCSLKVYL